MGARDIEFNASDVQEFEGVNNTDAHSGEEIEGVGYAVNRDWMRSGIVFNTIENLMRFYHGEKPDEDDIKKMGVLVPLSDFLTEHQVSLLNKAQIPDTETLVEDIELGGKEELTTIDGIGDATAEKIIEDLQELELLE